MAEQEVTTNPMEAARKWLEDNYKDVEPHTGPHVHWAQPEHRIENA